MKRPPAKVAKAAKVGCQVRALSNQVSIKVGMKIEQNKVGFVEGNPRWIVTMSQSKSEWVNMRVIATAFGKRSERRKRVYHLSCNGERFSENGELDKLELAYPDIAAVVRKKVKTLAALGTPTGPGAGAASQNFGKAAPKASRNLPQELVNQPASQLSGSVLFRQRPQKIFNLICKSRQQHGIFVWLRPSMPPGFHSISSDMIMLGIEEPLNHSFVCHGFSPFFTYGSPAWPRAPTPFARSSQEQVSI